MKRIKKGLILMVLVACIGGINIYADTLTEKIEVMFNAINIRIDGQTMVTDNILYNNTTYVPIRAAAEMLGMKVQWIQETNIANITSMTNVSNPTNGLNILDMEPKDNSIDGYLRWGYIHITFSEPMSGSQNIEDIYLVDAYGERIDIEEVSIGIDSKETILIIPKTELKLNTHYNLFIPKDNLISKDEKTYEEDVVLHFKTASNVLKGKIKSEQNYFLQEIKLKNDNNEYSTTIANSSIKNNNEFYFKNIEEGQYIIYLINEDGTNQFKYNVVVEANRINDIIIYDYQKAK